MLSYPSTISLFSRTLNHLADRIRRLRHRRRSRWRRLDPGRQALLALAHLRNGDTCTRLAAGFEVGVSTAWRYVREAVALLAAAADDLTAAMQRIRRLAYATPDEPAEIVAQTLHFNGVIGQRHQHHHQPVAIPTRVTRHW